MNIPVVLIIYKRKNNVSNLVNVLSKLKPLSLYIIADGPKNKSEVSICEQVRKNVEESITWDCKVTELYSDKNMGLRNRVVSGLNEVFKKKKWAIILEDDLIPDPSFFRFCEELLVKYEKNDKVISISGNNFQFGENPIKESYYFSRYVHSWGWATWRRAWKLYDDKMLDWPKRRSQDWLRSIFPPTLASIYWDSIFSQVYMGKIDSWAYRWTYTALKHKMYTVIPNTNLVSNVGSGSSATHSKLKSKLINMSLEAMQFPLRHPLSVTPNLIADKITERNNYFRPLTYISSIINKYIK